MGKVVLYIATSLDGKIARTNGSLDWLFGLPNPNQIDHGYTELLNSVEATMMGRKTYEDILGFGVKWPYVGKKSYVATTQPGYRTATPDTEAIAVDLASFVRSLKATTQNNIWLIGGGELVTFFLNHTLIDEMILCVAPSLLGQGIPLFPHSPKETHWVLVKAEPFETGIVNLTYRLR